MKEKLVKVIERLDPSIIGPKVLFSEQLYYGHRKILMAYAGASEHLVIRGSVDHG